MVRAAILLLLLTIDFASASWLRVGVLENSPMGDTRPQIRLSVPDGSWGWEGELIPAAGANGVLVSSPVWVPSGLEDLLVASVVGQNAEHAEPIQLVTSQSTQWFLDWNPKSPPETKPTKEDIFVAAIPRVSPNPFNLSTRIALDVPYRAEAELRVVDVLGRTSQVVFLGHLEAGSHSWSLDARSLASGTYFLSYRLSPGSSGATRLLLLK